MGAWCIAIDPLSSVLHGQHKYCWCIIIGICQCCTYYIHGKPYIDTKDAYLFTRWDIGISLIRNVHTLSAIFGERSTPLFQWKLWKSDQGHMTQCYTWSIESTIAWPAWTFPSTPVTSGPLSAHYVTGMHWFVMILNST